MIQLLAPYGITEKVGFATRFPTSYAGLFLFQEIIFDIIRSPITHAVDDRS